MMQTPMTGRIYKSYEEFYSRYYGTKRDDLNDKPDLLTSFGKRLAKILVEREEPRDRDSAKT